jgi:glycosyltransferase involved in cell wall biosynthesis
MTHLIFLTSTAPTIEEGSGTWVGISELRDALVSLGHEVTLMAPARLDMKETTLSRILFNLRAPGRIRRAPGDVLVGFDLDGVFVRLPHIAAIKGVLADEAQYERGIRRAALSLQAWMEARHVRQARRVITTSRYSAERIVQHYHVDRAKISVVPELIDLNAWDRALQAAPVMEGIPRILCVAHLYRRKKVDLLLRAFARIRGDAVLRIAGVGPEKEKLEALARQLGISNRTHFLGYLHFSGLVAEYRGASVFALPTAQEGFGIVFLEAMASSLPIVSTRTAAVPEVVPGSAGILVEPGNEGEVAAALERLLQDPQLRRAMGAAGRAQVLDYDAPAVAARFLEAIRFR